jgi:excinuclease ABC subunit C
MTAAGAGDVPVISLAKREEEVFLPGRSEPLRLPRDSAGLRLLQQIRDEAHRFALRHHRQRRGQGMTTSLFDGLPGVGPARRRAILRHFGSPERFLEATREELEAVPGLPPRVAARVHEHLHKTAAPRDASAPVPEPAARHGAS